MSKIIFKCKFGSHVYGTNLPTSDEDFKGVFIPDGRDLVLQRAAKHIENNTKADSTKKNSPEDKDDEMFSIQQFFKLLVEGQTVALDMLFTPKEFIIESSPMWDWIQSKRHLLLHKGTSAFVGYTKAQAAKYGVKGFRVGAVKAALEFMQTQPGLVKLQHRETELNEFIAKLNNKYVKVVELPGSTGELEKYLDICDRKIPFHAKIDYIVDALTRIYNNYGERAKMAENNEGIDWKALMHAVRVAHEAEELQTTGHITFPRPERELLLRIRQGLLPYKEVEKIIEEGLIKVEKAQQNSILPAKPNLEEIDSFIYHVHLGQIISGQKT